MSDLVERLRYATRDVVTGERLESGAYGHASIEDLEAAADRIVVLEGALGHAEREIERLRAELAELARDEVQQIERLSAVSAERDALRALVAALRGPTKAEAKLAAEIERLRAERDATAAEALGFAHAWCCNLLDLARDPRNAGVSQLLDDWNAARKP